MFHHYLIAAWRNMAANKLLSAIAILGLAAGIAAAILMALVIRNQVSFDAFLPLHERTYLVISPPNPVQNPWTTHNDFRTPGLLKNAPGVEAVTRVQLDGTIAFKQGDVTGQDAFYWADPNVFDVLRLPVLYGDLATALTRPDGIVLPREAAEKYFGQDDVVGRTITLDGNPMIVRAVIRDLPANGSELESGIFASGIASFSKLAPPDYTGPPAFPYPRLFRTYLRLNPGANAAAIESFVAAYYKPRQRTMTFPFIKLVPLGGVHLFEPLNPGIRTGLAAIGFAGIMVLLIAAINFVNLTVARSARREREIGIRKVSGADRRALMLQFLGEAVIAVALAAAIAMAASEWLLPVINAHFGTGADLNYGRDPVILPLLLAGIAGLGLAAGAYPAFVLSGFRPANVLRSWTTKLENAGAVRTVLVTLQFAILIGLAIAAAVIWQQRNYATREALRVDTDQMLILRLPQPKISKYVFGALTCAPALEDELRKLAGVKGVGCSGEEFLVFLKLPIASDSGNGIVRTIAIFNVSPNLLSLYGVKPLAGSLDIGSGAVINMAQARKMGFASPEAALGHSWIAGWPKEDVAILGGPHSIITAVVPDFALYSVTLPVVGAVYSQWTDDRPETLLHLKLNGRQIPETLAAIDKLWVATNHPGTPDRFFLNAYMQQQYVDMTREAALLAIFAGVAIMLSCLGLIGIAVTAADRRTKEIGIRKAMGATSAKILTLLLFQFAQPVLWANVIAWPVAWWAMNRWLSGFAYHVDLNLWLFLAASLAALVIALASVLGQAMLVARQKPVLALRYE